MRAVAWLSLDARSARALTADDAVRAAADALRAGRILALKGIGGYHLACRADDEDAVAALRARKHREDKPFALMARDLDAAHELVELDAVAARAADEPAAADRARAAPRRGAGIARPSRREPPSSA